ncbi:MAG: hypothetical protein U9N87_06235, partial [Planctomycetota bacterium]|nr:hypothetical protein [Planctomycetota bacterium]
MFLYDEQLRQTASDAVAAQPDTFTQTEQSTADEDTEQALRVTLISALSPAAIIPSGGRRSRRLRFA